MDAKDSALIFEAVKVALRQTKDGAMLTLSVHPNDFPQDLFKAWVGTRYQCVLVELNDQDEPVQTTESREGKEAVARAGILCRDVNFQNWMYKQHPRPGQLVSSLEEVTEETTAKSVCLYCGIDSRSELSGTSQHSKIAREEFDKLISAYNRHLWEGKHYGWT